ncbi:hypothetical protein FHS14_005553 [Paenibacillus baekrokdamisoli]|nr:hypothetical protein [Paenibacillus baekrokdamisoli]
MRSILDPLILLSYLINFYPFTIGKSLLLLIDFFAQAQNYFLYMK